MVGYPQCVKYLTCGRVITLRCEDQHAIAVTLSTSTRGTRTYKCLGRLIYPAPAIITIPLYRWCEVIAYHNPKHCVRTNCARMIWHLVGISKFQIVLFFRQVSHIFLIKLSGIPSIYVLVRINHDQCSWRFLIFLVLTEKTEKWWTESLKSSQDRVTPHKYSAITKTSSKAHIVLDLDPAHIHTITTQSIKLAAPDKIAENYSKRQIPRFKWVHKKRFIDTNSTTIWSDFI